MKDFLTAAPFLRPKSRNEAVAAKLQSVTGDPYDKRISLCGFGVNPGIGGISSGAWLRATYQNYQQGKRFSVIVRDDVKNIPKETTKEAEP